MDFDNGIFHTTRDWEYPVGGVWICVCPSTIAVIISKLKYLGMRIWN